MATTKKKSSDTGLFEHKPKKLKIDKHEKIKPKNFSNQTKFNNKIKKTDPLPLKTGTTGSEEKTDWRKFKNDKKELRLKRRGTGNSEISVEAKKLYEKLKCKNSENKTELVLKLYNIICGDVLKKFVMAHDTARIIQCMLKFATPSLREQISSDLMGISVDMATSKYAHFCVLRMFKYGSPKTKQNLIDSFYGNIVKLSSHNISHKILDHAYLFVATENQRALMRQEFYGDLYKNTKDIKVKSLGDCYKGTEQMKTAILSSVKSNLEHIANKNLVDNSLVHSILMEFLKEIDDEEKKEEIINIYGPLIPHLLTTRDGSTASIDCFYHSPAKNRRVIVKAIKDHLTKICLHEHGHVFLLAVLNTMDDTKAIKKSIFDAIYISINDIISDKWGRRVIEWFIAPAEKDFIHPHMLKTLDEGLKFGKKDKDLRRKEIQEQVEGPISESIEKNSKLYLKDGHIGLFTASILNKLTGDNFKKAATGLVKVICDDEWFIEVQEQKKTKEEKEEIKKVPGIEDAGLHIALKKIIKKDSDRNDGFGKILIEHLNTEVVGKWLTSNRGCFVLINILQNNPKLLNEIKDIAETNINILKKETTTGAKLLMNKLNL